MQINPVLVEVFRGNVLESFHRGVICVVDKDGKIIYSEGDVQQICYPRSALKFFQQIPLLVSGAADHFEFSEQELAITCGSHNGEQVHLDVVDNILSKIGLDRSYLKCGAQMPTLRQDMEKLIKEGGKPQTIHNNCSGKHAGFLAYCVFKGYDPTTYTSEDHPMQKEILKLVSEFYEYPIDKINIALDGCSAPIFSFPVYNQAVAYKNLVCSEKFGPETTKACNRLVNAIAKYPMMVAGNKRYCTDMISVCGERIIGKTGAEGIYGLAFREEMAGACIKIDDGKMLPQYNVAQKLIEASGIFSEDKLKSLKHYIQHTLTNYGQLETGIIKVADNIANKPFL